MWEVSHTVWHSKTHCGTRRAIKDQIFFFILISCRVVGTWPWHERDMTHEQARQFYQQLHVTVMHAHTHTQTRTRTHTHARTHTSTRTHTHTQTHTNTHTHTHKHMHKHTHMLSLENSLVLATVVLRHHSRPYLCNCPAQSQPGLKETALCTLPFVHCLLYTAFCTLPCVHCLLYTAFCTLLPFVHCCLLYTAALCTLPFVHC